MTELFVSSVKKSHTCTCVHQNCRETTTTKKNDNENDFNKNLVKLMNSMGFAHEKKKFRTTNERKKSKLFSFLNQFA